MLLVRLQIENYKGIRFADVSFHQTTALIGENETGKETLFEILREILDPLDDFKQFTYTSNHFHLIDNAPAGDISIMLTFQERGADEWDSIRELHF